MPEEIWREPIRGGFPGSSFFAFPGIEQMIAWARGLLPRIPLNYLTGFELTKVGAGSITATMPASPWLQNPAGQMDLLMFSSMALHSAITTGAPAGVELVPMSHAVTFIRSCTVESGSLIAQARTVSTGRRRAFAEAEIEDARGRLLAHSVGSVELVPMDPPPAARPLPAEPVPEPSYATPHPYLRPFDGPTWLGAEVITEPVSGMEAGRRALTGEVPRPPIDFLTGMQLVDVGEGTSSYTMPATEWLASRHRRVTVGPLTALAWSACASAAFTNVPAGGWMLSYDLSVSEVSAPPADGRILTARAETVHGAAPMIVTRCEIRGPDGALAAAAQATFKPITIPAERPAPEPRRVLASVLFTDIVDSTRHAERLGDAEWHRVLSKHNDIVRTELKRTQGREVKTTGDGFLAAFDVPARAVECARAIRDGVRALGIEIRAGIHTGECELLGADVGGIAVHIAARVQAAAQPSEVLVTGTVVDLAQGSGLRFADRGEQVLKGVEGARHLFALDG